MCAAPPPFTGRVNLFAEAAGLAVIDAAAIDRINAVDECVTVATLAAIAPVGVGDMVATVKIIPFATPGATLKAALAALGDASAVAVAPFRPLRIAVVSTLLPGLKTSVVAKTLRSLEARLAPTGASVVAHETTPHEIGPLADALARLAPGADALVIFGASAITDRRDVIPAADRGVRRAGSSGSACRSIPAICCCSRARGETADPRRARLRPLAQGERLRLGAAAPARRRSDVGGRHPRAWASAAS